MRLQYLCWLAVLNFAFFSFVDCLKAKDKGVCVVSRSVRKTRSKAYQVRSSRWCGNKRCMVKKTKVETYKATRNETVCCSGWQYKSDTDSCAPQCSTGCNGRCIAPDVCQPHSTTTLLPDHKITNHPLNLTPEHNISITIHPPCEGNCTSKNTCQENYIIVNGECKPKCDSCLGRCIAPNVCECYEGYTKSEGVCKPKCEDCEHGVCTAPNVCKCDEAYVTNGSKACTKPCPEDCKVCDENGICLHGFCERRMKGKIAYVNVCCPNWMYDKTQQICRPICRSGCFGGECIKPDVCECKPPLILENNNRCVPSVVCDSPCVNGTCTGNNTCTCNNGYSLKDQFTCAPECKQSCVNGLCIEPNKCSCLKGYRPKNEWECEPICDRCENGECVGPNECKCNNGYTKRNSTCVPECESDCVHGRCSQPNTCTCDVGYNIDPLDRFTCRPICEPACVNASCIAPNQCSCLPGYESLNASICKPKCQYCLNGDCVGPNDCRCHEGYRMEGLKCKPACNQSCDNGFCSAPNTCTCYDGYALDENTKTCQPVCSQNCVNATCVGPDECRCILGHEKSTNNFTCQPKCSTCENGDCISPEFCLCHEGYIMAKGVCEPVCSEDCVNGFCRAPNECACLDGYERNSVQSFVCYKPCAGSCSNGTCNINGTCECHPGFVLENDTCVTPVDCNSCEVICVESDCSCVDGRQCLNHFVPAKVTNPTGLAGLQLSWLLGGCLGIILITSVIVVIGHMWKRRQRYVSKTSENGANAYGSVAYTTADTLMKRTYNDEKTDERYNFDEMPNDNVDEDDEQATAERLLASKIVFEHEKL